jgi:hypothetical protein
MSYINSIVNQSTHRYEISSFDLTWESWLMPPKPINKTAMIYDDDDDEDETIIPGAQSSNAKAAKMVEGITKILLLFTTALSICFM